MIALIFLGITLFFAQNGEASTRNNPVVETSVGSIRGIKAPGEDYTKFMGIPYAYVNEDNVFGNAIPQPPFEGVFDAIDDSAICPQIEEFNSTFVGSLDCLHINVYVPDALSVARPLPVMVYIYGGGFSIGFAGRYLYGPKYIVRHDVIMVTFNYRLGPYGFMCLDEPSVSGNQGLKDQVLALKWLQENIGAFGGDPDRVTLFGNSAGGMSADFLMYSNVEPMFNNAILQSGSAMFPTMTQRPDSTALLIIAEQLGNPTNDVKEALSFLSKVDPQTLIEFVMSNGLSFGTCVESYVDNSTASTFMNNYPININNLRLPNNVSILMGVNSDELLVAVAHREPEYFLAMKNIVNTNLMSIFDMDDNLLNEVANIVSNYYFGDEEVSIEVKQDVLEFLSDSTFVYPTVRSIPKYINNGVENIFFYLFSYDGGRNFVKRKSNITEPGVAHADEIGYLFEMDYMSDSVTNEDQLIIDRMTTMWTNFAKYDNPTPVISSLLPIKWEPIKRGSPNHYLEINTELKADVGLYHARMSFWDLFYRSYGEYQRGYGYVPTSVSSASILSANIFDKSILLAVIIIVNSMLSR